MDAAWLVPPVEVVRSCHRSPRGATDRERVYGADGQPRTALRNSASDQFYWHMMVTQPLI